MLQNPFKMHSDKKKILYFEGIYISDLEKKNVLNN